MQVPEKVKHHLSAHGVAFTLIPHGRTTTTHENAQQAEVAQDHIAKAVILRNSGQYVMAVVPGHRWVRLDALSAGMGRHLSLAAESEIDALFPDCLPGAVPPLGPAYGMETCVEDSLHSLANVYFEAGDHQQLVHVSGDDFQALLQGARRGHFCHS